MERYKQVVAAAYGGPDVLRVEEKELYPPGRGEALVRVLATMVCGPDITVRRGTALYSGTFLGQKVPVVLGYSVIGVVEQVDEGVENVAVGDRVGALTVVGGYTEYIPLKAEELFPVPESVDPGKAIPLILNYLVAYQIMHRSAGVEEGETALIIGASGGIGTAFLDLGELAGLRVYGLASKSKHEALLEKGIVLLDYRDPDYLAVLREAEPEGLDYVFDGMMTLDYVQRGYSLLRKGGTMVSYGEPPSRSALFRILAKVIRTNLLPSPGTLKLYGTSKYTIHKEPFLEDWAALFRLLEDGKIDPVMAARFPILEARQANEMMERGEHVGNIVLVDPACL